jgi:2-oxoglutarate ferredoxin oxidoreductase subunit delta
MIIIDEEMCKGCSICIEVCPKGTLEISVTINRRGYYIPVVKDQALCACCRLCETICPDFAIFMEEFAIEES